MSPQEMKRLLAREPFIELRLRTKSGKAYDIKDPRNCLLLYDRIDVGVDIVNGIPDRLEMVNLNDIVRVDEFAEVK